MAKLNTSPADMSSNSKPPIGGFGGRQGHGHGHGRARGVIEKPKDFKGTLRKLIKYLKPYRFLIILVLLFAIISTIFSVLIPKTLGDITNKLLKA